MNGAIENFKQAIRNAGIEPPNEIIADGILHRYTVHGDKPGKKNGWYVLHPDTPTVGSFGCWKRGISEKWCCKATRIMTAAEKTAYSAKVKLMKDQRKEEQTRIWAECRKWSAGMWEEAKDATNEHPYLKRKGVNAYRLKSFKDSLIIPVQDVDGTIHGVQFITPDGTKKLKTGTNKTGHFFKIGSIKDNTIVICEGYATGASIHHATGHAVIVAFDSGNLSPVAQTFRSKFPDMKIIIAGDDDYGTKGNPGLTKAEDAARAVCGVLAVPIFPDTRGVKDTDFNDLARLVGLDTVRMQIEAAIPVEGKLSTLTETVGEVPHTHENYESQENPLDTAIQRLAALSPLQYDQVRKSEAKALGVRPTTLDSAVKESRKEGLNDSPFEEVDPWPEAVDGAELLTAITKLVQRFIICSTQTAHAVALWIAMTWFIDVVQIAPLAVITAPEKRCGKSLLLSLIGKLVLRPLPSSSISPSALFRSIDAWEPTLLIDEFDACSKDNEELRGLINCGHTRDSAFIIRCQGDDYIPKKFNAWGAKALSGIGHVADTLMDRAIVLELRRKLPDEKIDRIRHAEPGLFDELSSKLARFAEDNAEQVRLIRPALPPSLNDRAQDNWEPLLAIAKVAGGGWYEIGIAAALKLSGGENLSQSFGTELLSDIQEIFERNGIDRISTAELIKELCSDDEKPWATFNKGFQIKPRQIAAKLKGYGIHSKTVRTGYGETPKGYEVNQFKEAFSRYVHNTPHISATTPQDCIDAGLRVADTENNTQQIDLFRNNATSQCCGYESNVADGKNSFATSESASGGDCGIVADKIPFPASNTDEGLDSSDDQLPNFDF